MAKKFGSVLLAVVGVCVLSIAATGSVIDIGGAGAVSTSDPPYGPLGLLSEGEVGTAVLQYTLSDGGVTLTLTVTNTSPAVTGTESPTTPDAPVISAVMFSVPTVITGMTLDTVDGEAASGTGWDFTFDPNAVPSTGFGFLKNNFDAFVDGGPGGGPGPSPVIASVNDPDITDGPGDPIASPVDFVFTLTFGGGFPSGFDADWFIDPSKLGDPTWLAAADFMSGANGGSGPVTNGTLRPGGETVPAPAALMSLMSGLAILGGYKLRRKS